MIGLVSGMALSITAFILPPTIRFSLSFPKDKSYTPLYIAIDFVIFVFGLFAAFATTYMSLMNLLKASIFVSTLLLLSPILTSITNQTSIMVSTSADFFHKRGITAQPYKFWHNKYVQLQNASHLQSFTVKHFHTLLVLYNGLCVQGVQNMRLDLR